jgi:hypothetical protein
MKFIPFVVPAFALAIVAAGCNASGGPSAGGSSIDTSNGANNGTNYSKTDDKGTDGTANGAIIGESCVSNDPNKLCLAMHFVTYTSGGVPAASEAQLAQIVKKMNEMFSQCDIGFQIEHHETANPSDHGLAYGAASQNQLTQIRNDFTNSNDELLAVTTGPWGTAVNAWTAMPGGGPYGAIMESSIVGYNGGIIYAHEFGHYLGLDHYGNTANLMNPVIYGTSTQLTSSQCETARSTASSYWAAMLRH